MSTIEKLARVEKKWKKTVINRRNKTKCAIFTNSINK